MLLEMHQENFLATFCYELREYNSLQYLPVIPLLSSDMVK